MKICLSSYIEKLFMVVFKKNVLMITEISLHVPNRPGQFARTLKSLAKGNVNVLAFAIDQAGVYSIMRLVCHPLDKAVEQLQKYAYSIVQERLFAIPIPQESGKLQPVTELFGKNDINIEYGYLTLRPGTNEAIVLLKTDDDEKEKIARKLLIENGCEDLDDLT